MLRVGFAVVLFSFAAAAQQAPTQKPASQPAPPVAPAPAPVDKTLPLPAGDQIPLALPGPALPALDLSLLKDTSLCVSPFIKETQGGAADKAYLESVQKTFFEVAKQSPLLKDAVLLGQSALCDVHDSRCFSDVGRLAHCQNVLVGSSAAKGNGFVLSVRIFEVGKSRVMPGSEVEQVLETDRQSDVQAWAEGQACRVLSLKCVGRIVVDADRKDMNIYIDNRLAPRSFRTPEQIGVEPGVHGVRISIGQRTSLEKKVAVRRNQASDIIYARQTEKGGLPLVLASELRVGQRPGFSAEFHEGGWKKPIGWTIAGAGILAAGIGAYEGLHSKSLMNSANANYASQNAYLRNDVATIDSARNAATTANILFAVGGALVAAGLITVLAF